MNYSEFYKLPPCTAVCIVGLPGVGKTDLVKNLIYDNHQLYPLRIAFCESSPLKSDYRFNNPFYFRSCDPKLIDKYFEAFVKLYKEYAEKKEKNEKSVKDIKEPRLLAIIDDAMDCAIDFRSHKQEDYWKSKLSTARHNNITIVFVIQTLHKAIPPSIRSMIKIWYLFKNSIESNTLLEVLPLIETEDGKIIDKPIKLKAHLQKYLDEPYSALYFRKDETSRGIYGKLFKTKKAPNLKIKYEIKRD